MTKEKIERINFLYRKSKETELSPEEKAEQKKLRDEYRAAIRLSLIADLDNTVVIMPDGQRKPLKKSLLNAMTK